MEATIDYKLWLMIKNVPAIPKKMVDGKKVEKLEEEFKKMEQNAKTKNIIYYVVNPYDFSEISRCQIAK